jgi:hypothetical protein
MPQTDKMVFAIDFDGTCITIPQDKKKVTDVPHAEDTMKEMTGLGHQIILWTSREGDALEEAVAWFRKRKIPLLSVNENPNAEGRKIRADIYIDDRALGAPIEYGAPDEEKEPHLDWHKTRFIIYEKGRGFTKKGEKK